MHCFASENQTYTGTWLFGVESWKSLKGQENLLLKNLQVKTRVENVRFLSWRIFFVGKYGIQSTNEMAFKRTVTLRASFRFPAIRFDAPTLLSFSGFTHAHAKCPPVLQASLMQLHKLRPQLQGPVFTWFHFSQFIYIIYFIYICHKRFCVTSADKRFWCWKLWLLTLIWYGNFTIFSCLFNHHNDSVYC